LSEEQRKLIFIKRGIYIAPGARCCRDHVFKRQLTYDAIQTIKATLSDCIILNSADVQNLIVDCRSILTKIKAIDFDDASSLSDESYFNLTGLRTGTYFFR
jgi:hypothetical protein